MSYHYYPVEVTFNWWMVVAILNFFIMFVVGGRQYMLENLKIKRRFGEDVFAKTSFILTTFTATMFAVESSQGLLQIVINHLEEDQMKFADGITVVISIISFLVYGCLLYFVSTAAVVWKLEKIREERGRIIRQRHRRERKFNRSNDNMDPWVY